jgi:hypothetical protein
MSEGWTVGDLEPALTGTATGKVRADNPTLTDAEFNALKPVPVALTGATSTDAHIRRPDGSVLSRAVVPDPDQVAHKGQWSMAWVAAVPPAVADLSVAGGYDVEVEAVWPGVRPQTFGGASFQVARQIA